MYMSRSLVVLTQRHGALDHVFISHAFIEETHASKPHVELTAIQWSDEEKKHK